MSAPELKISTANDVPAILHDGPDGVPQSGHSVSKERLSLSTREMNDHKDTVNNNDNEEACDTSTGAGTGFGVSFPLPYFFDKRDGSWTDDLVWSSPSTTQTTFFSNPVESA